MNTKLVSSLSFQISRGLVLYVCFLKDADTDVAEKIGNSVFRLIITLIQMITFKEFFFYLSLFHLIFEVAVTRIKGPTRDTCLYTVEMNTVEPCPASSTFSIATTGWILFKFGICMQ